MYNEILSREIFRQLVNGKVINRTELNNSAEFTENRLYSEIMENLDQYRMQYKMSGYEFVDKSDFVFIRDKAIGQADLKTDITMKICILLRMIGKYITENNYKITKLTAATGGLTSADFEAIQQMPTTTEILEKSGMKTDIKLSILSVLVERNILLEKPSSEAYVLSDVGREFFDQIADNYQS